MLSCYDGALPKQETAHSGFAPTGGTPVLAKAVVGLLPALQEPHRRRACVVNQRPAAGGGDREPRGFGH